MVRPKCGFLEGLGGLLSGPWPMGITVLSWSCEKMPGPVPGEVDTLQHISLLCSCSGQRNPVKVSVGHKMHIILSCSVGLL